MKIKDCVIDLSLHRCTKSKALYPVTPWRVALFKRDILVKAKYGGKYRGFKKYFHVNLNSRYTMEC